jgi:hypothetical protein
VDYLVTAHLGARPQEAFLADLTDGTLAMEWGEERDLDEARRLSERYTKLLSDSSTPWSSRPPPAQGASDCDARPAAFRRSNDSGQPQAPAARRVTP